MRKKKYIVFLILFVIFILSNIYIPNNIKSIIKIPRDMLLSISNIYNKPLINLKDNLKNKDIENNVIDSRLLESENIELKKEIDKLKNQLELNNILSDKLITNATVISRNLNDWNRNLIIDKGSLDGIKDDMVVLYNGYLIGLIYNTSLYSSEVDLLMSIKKKLSVKIDIGSKEIYGILNKYEDGFKIEGITDMDEIPSNSLITTSGLNDNVPSGLKIGYVSEVASDNFDLARIVNITPGINFNDINYVMVVMKK